MRDGLRHVASRLQDGLRNLFGGEQDQFIPTWFRALVLMLQMMFSVFYFFAVVSKYRYWMGPTPLSAQLQAEPAHCATMRTSPTNCVLAWFCPQARAAHTFDRTGTLEYWCSCLSMFLCPFCTLCFANACTDLNPKLGGEQQNIIASAACTWCCSCCVIAQDAESLDAATGSQTECCGVSAIGAPYAQMGPGMYPGAPGANLARPGMYPGQQMMPLAY